MARTLPRRMQESIWDRLTDPAPAPGKDVGFTEASEIERVKDAVRRDLEWLLNSRRPPIDLPDGMDRLASSLVSYGLPDVTGISSSDPNERDRLQRTLAQTIRDFEPRLTDVRVTFEPSEKDRLRGALHYRVSALLRIEPKPEPIVFDTVLDLGNRAFSVKRD